MQVLFFEDHRGFNPYFIRRFLSEKDTQNIGETPDGIIELPQF
jgi:hypothetical protein